MRSIEATAEATIQLAEETGAVVYPVRFDTRWWVESDARKHEPRRRGQSLPFEVDIRIPLPPEFGGPEVAVPGAPAPRRPRIEVGAPKGPPVTVVDPVTGRRTTSAAPARDEIGENLDRIYGEADAFLESIASRTGGRVLEASTFENSRSAFAKIAEELRHQYLLGFYPTADRRDGKFHRLRVEVSRKGLAVRARSGYRSAESDRGRR
jgi:VWFA-related protein